MVLVRGGDEGLHADAGNALSICSGKDAVENLTAR